MGRHKKITASLIETVCEALEDGATHKIAANLSGIVESTYHNWRALGRKGNGDLYQDFLEMTDSAIAINAMKSLEVIKNSKDPKDHKWLLERRHGFTKDGNAGNFEEQVIPDGLSLVDYTALLLKLTSAQRSKAVKDGSHVAAAGLIKLELSLKERLEIARKEVGDDPASLTKEEWQEEVERKAQALELPDLEVMVKEYMSRTGATLKGPEEAN